MSRLILPGSSPGPVFRYLLVDVKQVEPSDVVEFNGLFPEVRRNSLYPLGAQGRVYGRGSVAGKALLDAADRPRLDYLLDRTGTPAFGPPVVVGTECGERFLVVAGHQRAAVLRWQDRVGRVEFWRRYAQAAREDYPELYQDMKPSDGVERVVVRLLEIRWADSSSRVRALRVLNRLSDAPVTKPRDVLAVVRGLAEEILELPVLRGIFAGCLPHGPELVREEDEQLDVFGVGTGSRAESVSSNSGAPRSSSVSPILRAIGRRLDAPNVQEELYEQLFVQSHKHSLGDTDLNVALLTEQDKLAVYRHDGDRRVMTEEARQAFAYLAVAVGLGGGGLVERLADVRELYYRSGQKSLLPGRESLPWVLEFSGALLAAGGFKSASEAGVLRLLGDTVLVELALHPAVLEALTQPALGGDSRPSLAWVSEVIENADAVASYEQLRVNRGEWKSQLQRACKPSPRLSSELSAEVNRRLDELRQLLTTRASKNGHSVLVMLAIAFLKTKGMSPPQASSERGALKRGRGRPRVEPVDIAFSLFCLAALTQWQRKRVPTDLDALRNNLKSGLARYEEWLRENQDLVKGSTLAYRRMHDALREALPVLGRGPLPKLTGARILRDALNKWPDGSCRRVENDDTKRLLRITRAGRRVAKDVSN